MDFIEIKVNCAPAYIDIFIAEFAEIGFDSFVENEDGFEAYAEEDQFSESKVQNLSDQYLSLGGFTYTIQKIEKKNWNEEWEKNYDPIIVSDQCIVKASFHNIEKTYPYEILINPKMSFGTGHHATTFLMLSQQLDMDFKKSTTLDAGCGTGILGIMASLKGANHVDFCDIDEWCIENSKENISLNGCENIDIYFGTVEKLPKGKSYDTILANINKNVLLEEIPLYANLLASEGNLLLSGFYEEDIEDIESMCIEFNFHKVKYLVKDKWACTLFRKSKS